jgi:hypothetical protein
MQSDPDPSQSGRPPSRRGVDGITIEPSPSRVRVTLSVPAGSARLDSARKSDRKRILERARKMLAAALEEERRTAQRQEAEKSAAALPRHTRPGAGAWWLF